MVSTTLFDQRTLTAEQRQRFIERVERLGAQDGRRYRKAPARLQDSLEATR